jgi:hypothetical protein
MFSGLRRDVLFVDIGGIVDHHCLTIFSTAAMKHKANTK